MIGMAACKVSACSYPFIFRFEFVSFAMIYMIQQQVSIAKSSIRLERKHSASAFRGSFANTYKNKFR
jgi:hypothetical protein